MHPARRVIVVVEASTAYGRGILRGIAKYSRLHGPWSINMDPWEIYNKELPRMADWQGNLVVAGRPISATHEAAASLRVIPPCYATGEAAGVAAALAARPDSNVDIPDVDTDELRARLREQGALV